jgi:Rrf2 family transcriptional regulator, cysteine metabolism repressor
MKVSTKGRYGLRAMMDLAIHQTSATPIYLSGIAKRQGISEKYLEQIFATLQSAGLVRTVRGRKGGYLLTRPPQEITLSEIFRVLEGPCNLVTCISEPSTCERTPRCATRELWQLLGDRMEEVLAGTTLADLAERQNQIGDRESAMYYI